MKLRTIGCLLGIAWLSAGCTGEVGDDVRTLEDELVLLEKPGTSAARFTEAGQDIERLGPYTFYSANGDGHSLDSLEGSAQLFKDGAPHRSFQARTGFYATRLGFYVAMSDDWLAADVQNFIFSPGVIQDAVLLVGRNGSGDFSSCGSIGQNGELPNCVTCQVAPEPAGQPEFLRTTCTPKPGITVIRPAAFSSGEGVDEVELSGNELFVPSSQRVALLTYDGTSWMESAPLLAPAGETFTGRISVSGNRLALSASGLGSAGHVIVYQRANATSPWQVAFRVHPTDPNVSGFGSKLDLSGNSLVVMASASTHFFDLVATLPADPNAGVTRSCVLPGSNFDVAVSGSNVVIATVGGMPKTYLRGDEWHLHGGLPSGIFPRDKAPNGDPTTYSLWGAAVNGDDVAIGWRNYRGANQATETGAGIEFSFDDYDCGYLRNLAGGGVLRAADLLLTGVSVPQWSFPQFPPANAIDGDTNTRWMGPNTPGTKVDFTFTELEMLSHLEIDWGTTYSHNYTVQVTENGATWFDVAQVTNGNGGVETVNLSTSAQAFGKAIRIKMNGFKVKPGTGDWGVSIREFKAFRRVHDECSSTAALICTGAAPAHVCENSCGGRPTGLTCFCDGACGTYGDCCSFDGAHLGAEYESGVFDVCGYD